MLAVGLSKVDGAMIGRAIYHSPYFLAEIERDRVTIIDGETSCGKSSRLPAFLVEDADANNKKVKMFVSQPRRIAASSLKKRLDLTLPG